MVQHYSFAGSASREWGKKDQLASLCSFTFPVFKIDKVHILPHMRVLVPL